MDAAGHVCRLSLSTSAEPLRSLGPTLCREILEHIPLQDFPKP
ncbi:hypothetical protein V1264_001621 [Littorina saxatilis]|uniref:Uncharacterized protein n=1 Tax=Littorina saxatilis TaxID=31220 RepID=A0AAN9C2R3_9CAEN